MDKSDNILFDEWEDAIIDQLIQAEELVLSSIAKSTQHQHPQPPPPPLPPPQLPQYSAALSSFHPMGFSPPRELSQRPTTDFDSPPRPQKPSLPPPPPPPSSSTFAPAFRPPDSDKDQEIERLKRELGTASKKLEDLERECLKLKKDRDTKEDQLKSISCKNEAENSLTNRSKITKKDSGILAHDYHKISSFQNPVSSKDQSVEKTFKSKGVETDIVSHQEAQGSLNDDIPACLDLSHKLLAVRRSPTDKRLGSNAISKLLVCCQSDFHILFGFMSVSLPSEITRKFLTKITSSRRALHYHNDCFRTPEAAKVSYLYLVLTKINDGTTVLEAMIDPLLDLCGMANVVVVLSSLCILHTLLKFLLEMENNFGRRDNVYIEGVIIGKEPVNIGRPEGANVEKLFNEEVPSRKECWNDQNASQTHVNWIYLFEIMHQIAMRIKEERVRVEAVSIMNLVLLKCNAYSERAQLNQKIVFNTISELLKKDAGLLVKRHALRLLYLVLNCPKLLATFCCGCKEGESSSAVDDNTSASDFKNFETILQGLGDCVASRGGVLLELKTSRNAILVLAFLASSGKPGFEIFIGHRLSRGANYLMLILQLLVSVLDLETGVRDKLPEIFRERTFLMREILILLNRLVSNPSYSAIVLRGLVNTRDMAGLTVDVATRLSRKTKELGHQDSMVKHVRETEIVDLALVFKKRVFQYLGDDLL